MSRGTDGTGARCPRCEEPVGSDDRVCGSCGEPLPTGGRWRTLLPLAVTVLVLIGVAAYVLAPSDDADDSDDPSAAESGVTGTAGSPPGTTGGASSPAPSTTEAGPIAGAPGPPDNPLGIDLPYRNQPCTAKYLVMLATAGLEEDNPPQDKLPAAAAGRADARYLHNQGSCSTAFTQTTPNGQIFQAYVGPYDSAAEACRSRARGEPGTWVKHLGDPSVLYCICEEEASALPTIAPPIGDDSNRYRVSDVQQLLHASGFNPVRHISGEFDRTFEEQLMAYQRARRIPATGEIDAATWRAVTADAC